MSPQDVIDIAIRLGPVPLPFDNLVDALMVHYEVDVYTAFRAVKNLRESDGVSLLYLEDGMCVWMLP